MRVALLGLTVGLIIVPSLRGSGAPEGARQFLLSPGKAGALEAGAPIDEIYNLVGRENTQLVDLHLEGMYAPALQVKLPGSSANPALLVEVGEWPCHTMAANRIHVMDSRYRTAEGFGVGTTAAELSQRHPFKISEAEGAHAAIIEALQMTFSFERTLPIDQARVTEVMLWSNPAEIRRRRCPELGPIGEPAPGSTVGPQDQLRMMIDANTGRPAADCGQHLLTRIGDDWVPADRDIVEKSLACALAHASARQSFSTFRQKRGIDSWVAQGWIGDHSGVIQRFVFEGRSCVWSSCAPGFELTRCDQPAIVATADGDFDLSCAPRSLARQLDLRRRPADR